MKNSGTPQQVTWKECFARSSEPHWDALLRFGLSLSKTEEQAQDLLQNTLLRGVRFFEKFAQKSLEVSRPDEVMSALQDPGKAKHFKNWLYKILRNVYLDDLASQKRFAFEADPEALDSLEAPEADEALWAEGVSAGIGPEVWDPEAEKSFFRSAASDELLMELNQLSDRQRSVLYLVAEDHSYKEVSQMLGIPMGTVMSTLSRGLQKLKQALSQNSSEGFAGGIKSATRQVTKAETQALEGSGSKKGRL